MHKKINNVCVCLFVCHVVLKHSVQIGYLVFGPPLCGTYKFMPVRPYVTHFSQKRLLLFSNFLHEVRD